MDSSLSSTHHVVPEMTSVPSSNTWPSTTQPGLPSRPPRVAIPQASYNPPVSSRHCAEAGDPVYGEKVILSHHRSSVSDGFSVMSGHTADTIDLEKAVMVAESQRSHHSRRDSARNDVAERQHSSILHSSITGGTSPRHHCANSPYARYDPDAEQDMLDARQMQESNAARILVCPTLPSISNPSYEQNSLANHQQTALPLPPLRRPLLPPSNLHPPSHPRTLPNIPHPPLHQPPLLPLDRPPLNPNLRPTSPTPLYLLLSPQRQPPSGQIRRSALGELTALPDSESGRGDCGLDGGGLLGFCCYCWGSRWE